MDFKRLRRNWFFRVRGHRNAAGSDSYHTNIKGYFWLTAIFVFDLITPLRIKSCGNGHDECGLLQMILKVCSQVLRVIKNERSEGKKSFLSHRPSVIKTIRWIMQKAWRDVHLCTGWPLILRLFCRACFAFCALRRLADWYKYLLPLMISKWLRHTSKIVLLRIGYSNDKILAFLCNWSSMAKLVQYDKNGSTSVPVRRILCMYGRVL